MESEIKIYQEGLQSESEAKILFLITLEAESFPSLPLNDELKLAEIMIKGRKVEEELSSSGKSSADYPELQSLIKSGRQAKEELINANLKYVIRIARNVYSFWSERGISWISLLDLIQTGFIALISGVDNFDPVKKVRVIKYSHWRIFQAMNGWVEDHCRNIRIPRYLYEEYFSRRPDMAELAQDSKINRKKADLLRVIFQEEVSFDEEEVAGLGVSIEEILNFRFMLRDLGAFLSSLGLSERELAVLTAAFVHGNTFRQIGRDLNMTQNQVNLTLTRIIRKMRHQDEREGLNLNAYLRE